MDYSKIEQDTKRLHEITQLLFGEGGFFADMSDNQKGAFGEYIRLLTKIQTLETVGDSCQVCGTDTCNNKKYIKPMCGACMCEPCMCFIEPAICDPMSLKYYDCVNCGSTPCVCTPESNPNQTKLPLDD